MLKNRVFHWLLIFFAFMMLIFSVQFILYLWNHLQSAEKKAEIHLLVREKAPEGFSEWVQKLGVQEPVFHDLETWSKKYESDWKDLFDASVMPTDLFQDRVAGVWVARVQPPKIATLIRGREELNWKALATNSNVVTALGYPRWSQDLHLWFWTWSTICALLAVVAMVMLISAVMADVSIGMISQREELEIKHWLGATRRQLRAPLVRALLARSLGIILLSLCTNIVFYLYLAKREIIQLSFEWVENFSITSLAAVIAGILLVWMSSRLTFRRMINQWAP